MADLNFYFKRNKYIYINDVLGSGYRNVMNNKELLTDEEIWDIINRKYSYKTKYTKKFIFQAIKRYGDIYSYEKTNRVDNNLTKVIVTCPVHGDFEVDPYYFLTNSHCKGCYYCNPPKTGPKIKSNTKEFAEKLKKIFPEYKIADGEEYINNFTKMKFYCIKHKVEFESTPANLLFGKAACPECNRENIIESRRIFEEEKFIKFMKENFSDYDILDLHYVDQYTEVSLVCKKHPDYIIHMTPATIKRIKREGRTLCNICNKELSRLKRQNNFFKRAISVHGDAYDFSNAYYESESIPVIGIKCNKCGRIFNMYPQNLINGKGCPCSYRSTGELQIEKWLIDNNIPFKDHVDIPNTKIVGRNSNAGVEIDFCIEYNSIIYWIEYNGEQHYTLCNFFHNSLEYFEGQLQRDKNVRNYCKEHNIILIEIPWTYRTISSVFNILTEVIINGKNPSDVIIQPKIKYQRLKGGKNE